MLGLFENLFRLISLEEYDTKCRVWYQIVMIVSISRDFQQYVIPIVMEQPKLSQSNMIVSLFKSNI